MFVETQGIAALYNPAIDPAFVVAGAPAPGPVQRRETGISESPLFEAFAARKTVTDRNQFVVFPTARTELLFHFGDPFRVRRENENWQSLPRAALLGPRYRRYWQSAGPEIDWFLIQLSALGCRRLLGRRFSELWDANLPLEVFWGKRVGAVHAALAAEPSFDRRIELFLRAFGGMSLDSGGDEPISVLARHARSGSIRSVGVMAEELGTGERRLRQRFSAEIGLSPKPFLDLLRFNRRLLEVHPSYRRIDYAGSDYFDQSHAIRDFRRRTGMTPSSYSQFKSLGDQLVVTGPAERI